MNPRLVRRFAVKRLHLPNGEVLNDQVVEMLQADGKTTYRHYPLDHEFAFTEWVGGDFFLTE